jgi:predicted DNA-binding transcriptional regulator YafY
MISFRGEWYLIALDHKSGEIRIFAISRIDRADLTEIKFRVPADFNLKDYLGNHFGILTGEQEYYVRILFSPSQAPYVVERRWVPDQSLEEGSDGSVILGFRTNSLFEVRRWVLSWGGDARVLEPDALAEDVRRELEGALIQYT